VFEKIKRIVMVYSKKNSVKENWSAARRLALKAF